LTDGSDHAKTRKKKLGNKIATKIIRTQQDESKCKQEIKDIRTGINMWYFRFIVHRRSGQMNQDNPVQIEEMEVLKRDV
jgi:hypothetical protein